MPSRPNWLSVATPQLAIFPSGICSSVRSDSAEDGPEVGAGWKEVGEKAGDYVSLKIFGPLFSGGFIRANLFRADDAGRSFVLSLNAPQKRDEACDDQAEHTEHKK